MPRLSVKNILINYLSLKALFELENEQEEFENSDVLEDEILDEFVDDLTTVLARRRGILYFVPKSSTWCDEVVTRFDNNRFKQFMRCTKEQFELLESLIIDSEDFNNTHSAQQYSVSLQLAIVMYRLGSSGENASIRKIASIFGVGDGGTIQNITFRVFRAIMKLKEKFLYWPNAVERAELVNETYHELPYCVGYVDGTEFKFAEKPCVNHVAYYSRKSIYSIKAQITCDHKLYIRHVNLGSPGSVHDARIFAESVLKRNPSAYFSRNEWLAADSAYSLSDTVITPYRSNSTAMTSTKRTQFNLRHSQYRVRVEHCIGLLKERFGSLKELRHRISTENSIKLCCQWIFVSCILHNILMPYVELSTSNFENSDEDDENLENIPNMESTNRFENKRQAIFKLMFE